MLEAINNNNLSSQLQTDYQNTNIRHFPTMTFSGNNSISFGYSQAVLQGINNIQTMLKQIMSSITGETSEATIKTTQEVDSSNIGGNFTNQIKDIGNSFMEKLPGIIDQVKDFLGSIKTIKDTATSIFTGAFGKIKKLF